MSPFADRVWNVFVSCLVSDTYARVIGHLVNYIKMDGFGVVISRVEIGPGKPMDSMLRCLIEGCDIYVIVFSKNYATSNSRLWELAAIKEAAEAMRKRIVPVFYDVTVEDVKLKTDKYTWQLRQHTAESEATVEDWSNALRGTAQISGLNRRKSDADLCQEICGRVRDLISEKEQSVITLNATFTGCPNLSLEGLEIGSTPRTFLTIEKCGITSLLRPLESGNLIERITIRDCHKLKEVPFGQLKSLKVFDIEGCVSIESLSDVASAGKLEELRVANCPNLKVIEGLAEVARFLKILKISNCNSLESAQSKTLKIPRDPNTSSCSIQDVTTILPGEPDRSGGDIQSSFDEESERINSTPTSSSIISTSADHNEAEVEMHQPESTLVSSSSTSLTETPQNEDSEELTIQELDRLLELD